ncbi:MAG: glutamine synthetase family protein [Mobiluncus porci]|uniref:glutamine synthetase family protein n=1 Tax=Mobiluncus porci TaxID=2652278 RepID=UPI0023F2B333|nr:glutamine synthetase family protein [Mobiluncus porci]MDD7541502.1 glutamine synthetase family protein [Mobiluncus porci]MDY5748487.1 glutamine synthetase family protein [Mobiluncus porci]
MDTQQEHVIRQVGERDVKYVRLMFVDVLGLLKSITISPMELERAFTEGVAFDGSSVEGFTRISESDMLLVPDASTFQIVPSLGSATTDPVGRMFCDVFNPDGTRSHSDPRYVLERTMERANKLGFVPYVHPEIEFYLFKMPASLEDELIPIDRGGYFDHVSGGLGNEFRRDAVRALEELGISVEYSHHEGGPGQNEIDLRSVDALSCADNFVTTRGVVEEIALSQGLMATFMPKPVIDFPGNGLHLHFSLHEGDQNAFYDPGADYHLSIVGRQFTAGLLHYAKEISAIVNQHVNSYKRLWGGDEAPAFVCWGHHNRSALIRVADHKPGIHTSTRVEYRAPDPALNPYLAFALIIEAGLQGIEQRMELTEEAEDNVWEMSDAERKAVGISALPRSLEDAIRYLEESSLVPAVLGEEAFDFVLRTRLAEWTDYRRQVTAQEKRQLLRLQ